MSVTYRATTLPEANTAWGPPVEAGKTWGFFGANGANYLHGGTRGRAFSVSGTCLFSLNATIEGWQDGAVGDAVIDTVTYSNVLMFPSPTFGQRFADASDGGNQYNFYTVNFLQLRT